MLPKSKKQKGKQLENFVANELRKIDKYAYRRADSGSGLHRKEDVFTTLPLFIECKNQKELHINDWWKKTIENCPSDKYPILVFKQNYQREPTVCLWLGDLLSLLSKQKVDLKYKIYLAWSDFFDLIKSMIF